MQNIISNGIGISVGTNLVSPSAFDYILTSSGDAEVAYSFRKLSTDDIYNGPCLRLRRNVDNAELDVPFNGTSVDIDSMEVFCGAFSGFIVKWYDQSGNGNHSVQSVLASQPQVVSSGVTEVSSFNGLPAMHCVADYFLYTSGVPTTQLFYESFVIGRTASTNTHFGSEVSFWHLISGWNQQTIFTAAGTYTVHESLQSQTGDFLMTTLRDSSNNVKIYRNTTALATANYANLAGNYIYLMNRGTQTTGEVQEYILWAKDKELERTDIESNINDYYSIW